MKQNGHLLGDFINLGIPLAEQLDNEAFLLSVRSNTFSKFRFPIAIYGMHGEKGTQVRDALFPLIKDFTEKLQVLGGSMHFAVCDAAHSHKKVSFLNFNCC